MEAVIVKVSYIEENKTSKVDIVLKAFDISLDAPEFLYPSEDFTLTLTVDTKNPFLMLNKSRTIEDSYYDYMDPFPCEIKYTTNENDCNQEGTVITVKSHRKMNNYVPTEDTDYTPIMSFNFDVDNYSVIWNASPSRIAYKGHTIIKHPLSRTMDISISWFDDGSFDE